MNRVSKILVVSIMVMILFASPTPLTSTYSNELIQNIEPENKHQVSSTTTWVERFEGSWLPSGWSEVSYYGRKDWFKDSVGAHWGYYYAGIKGPSSPPPKGGPLDYRRSDYSREQPVVSAAPPPTYSSGILQSKTYDMRGSYKFKFEVYYKDYGIDSGDLKLYFKDAFGNWVHMQTLNQGSNGWFRCYKIIYFAYHPYFMHKDFQVRYYAKNIASGEIGGIDDQKIIKYSNDDTMKYSLCVGIKDYPAGAPCAYSNNDANVWYDIFENDLGYDIVTVLGDETSSYTHKDGIATESNIKGYLSAYMKMADDDDVVAFTFSGHGDSDHNSPHDAYMETYEYTSNGKLWDDEFYNVLSPADTERVFVFLDCCKAGGILEDFEDADFPMWMTTTCAYNGGGVGWGPDQLGLWTRCFTHDYNMNQRDMTQPLETIYPDGYDLYIYLYGIGIEYPVPDCDKPQLYQSDPYNFFYL